MKKEIDMSKYTIGIDPYDKQETLEEVAENFWLNDDSMTDNDRISYVNGFKKGAKWQQERSYSDMQEYATFCIECDRKEMPLLLVEDWYEHYKKK